ncbi:3-oxoacyl-ACP synthase III family protein [Actinoplanes derwentensis]|uniref:3-oxoacyl-[acyl-carrier-protein] synthase-3 n=1 Tax=Actinoplanes derwentensis TaxID=113562 RepID=A0A1H1Y8V2_9ACTN|nr:ketoacyl-ACP synthase III [Actinoplanes derwentensis]GID86690.1 3-oxoacyl-[acyl-carrier-protein] synthase 3 [Actinoplanes derwentensis]SDT17456.1 3-oxoacyl-[acyl-carrier-protein] synthase-3 [Actinoplanes derwentensis]
MSAIGILATGAYVPKQIVTGEDVAGPAGVTPEWIERKTQIAARRYAAPDEATSDLAAHAAAQALDRAGLDASAIRYLIVSTSTPDSPQPPTSYLVQNLLGTTGAACLDINVVCSGFVYGLALARALVAQDPGTYALVVAADVYSRILDVTDRKTVVLLGDGAGAAVVGPVPTGGFLDMELSSHGHAHGLISVTAGGSRTPTTHETVDNGDHLFRMDGRGVRDFVMDTVPGALRTLVERAGHQLADVGHFVPHQANGVMLSELVTRSGLDHAHTHRNLERYGNTGSASTALALDDAATNGHLHDGDLVLLAGFGGGMSLGAALLRWTGQR